LWCIAGTAGICVIAVSAPILAVYFAKELWQRRRRGLAYLLPFQARTVARFAEAAIAAEEEPAEWDAVASRVDRYLGSFQSPRKWRSAWLFTAIELLPLAHGKFFFSAMSRASRTQFCVDHLQTTRGVHGALSIARQLVRLGYYSRPASQRFAGFVPWELR
jgi:hypothetical protein